MATTKKAIAEAEQAAEIKEATAAPATEPEAPAVTLDELEGMDMIQTTEKPKWGEFKKRLEIVGGQIVDKTTGELVEGVQIIEKPDTFTVDV